MVNNTKDKPPFRSCVDISQCGNELFRNLQVKTKIDGKKPKRLKQKKEIPSKKSKKEQRSTMTEENARRRYFSRGQTYVEIYRRTNKNTSKVSWATRSAGCYTKRHKQIHNLSLRKRVFSIQPRHTLASLRHGVSSENEDQEMEDGDLNLPPRRAPKCPIN